MSVEVFSQDELPPFHEVTDRKVVVEKVLYEELEHLVVKLEGELPFTNTQIQMQTKVQIHKYKYRNKYKYTNTNTDTNTNTQSCSRESSQ